MDSEVLLALITKVVRNHIEKDMVSGLRGPRGFRGPVGEAGTPFIWEEYLEDIKSLIQESALKFSDLSKEEIESLRGPAGEKGLDGKGFLYPEHEAKIEEIVRSELENLKLKFSDLSEEEKESLRGPRGPKGDSGRGFIFEEHEEYFQSLRLKFSDLTDDEIKNLKLKFSDLSSEEIESLRGPRGIKGDPGRSFIFDEHKDYFESLKLKFSDLTDEELEYLTLTFDDLTFDQIESLRGPRGQRGKPGKDFIFSEHEEYFNSLKLEFSDLIPEEIDKLKLKFSDLTSNEIFALKLKFEDLTEEDKISLRGPRGQRGKTGNNGLEGPEGKMGPRGPIGPKGISGLSGMPGQNGIDGADGKDAPTIEDIEFKEYPRDEISLRMRLSDGTQLETNKIASPTKTIQVGSTVVMAGGGGGSATRLSELLDVQITNLQNGDILKYNASLMKWINVPDTGGGGLIMKSGVVLPGDFAGTPKKYSVVFITDFPGEYSITIGGVDARAFTYESRTTTGFTINTNADAILTDEVSWQAIEVGED